MLRPLSGFRAQYRGLTLIVVSEFDEWRVVAFCSGTIIQGQRQFSAAKAKEHALTLAKTYLAEIKHEPADDGQEIDWQPTGPQEWLLWKS
jgi:hypothetical protein